MQSSKIWDLITRIIAVAALGVCIFLLINPTGPKLAYVVNEEILQGYGPAVKVRQQKEALHKFHQTKVDSMQVELNTLQQVLQSGGGKKLADQIQNKAQFFQNYTQKAQQQLIDFDKSQMDSVYKIIDNGITEFAKANKYTMILGTMNGNIVYVDDANNVTSAVIEYLNTSLEEKE